MGRKVRRDPIDRIRSEVAQFRKSAVELGVKKIRLDQLSRKDDPDCRDSLTPEKREAKWRKINRSYQAGKRSLRASEQRLQVSVSEHVNEMPSKLSDSVELAQCLARVASNKVTQEDVEYFSELHAYPKAEKHSDNLVDKRYVEYVLKLIEMDKLKVDDRSDCADPGGASWNLFSSLKKPIAVCIALLRDVFGNWPRGFVVDDSGRKVRAIDDDHEDDRDDNYQSKLDLMDRVRKQSLDFDPAQLSPEKFADVFKAEDESILSEGDSVPVQAEIVRDLHSQIRRLGLEALLSSPGPARPERRRRRSSDIQ